MTGNERRAVGAIALVGLLVGLGGCDWWPPTLQERIGQLEAQIKTLNEEKATMQAKVVEMTKAAEDCGAEKAQLEQAAGGLKAQVDQLTATLEEEKAKSKKGKKK